MVELGLLGFVRGQTVHINWNSYNRSSVSLSLSLILWFLVQIIGGSCSKWIQSAGVQLIRLPLIGFSLSTMVYVLTSNFRAEFVSVFRVLHTCVCVIRVWIVKKLFFLITERQLRLELINILFYFTLFKKISRHVVKFDNFSTISKQFACSCYRRINNRALKNDFNRMTGMYRVLNVKIEMEKLNYNVQMYDATTLSIYKSVYLHCESCGWQIIAWKPTNSRTPWKILVLTTY